MIYILTGEEEFLKESGLAKIKNRYLLDTFNYAPLDGKTVTTKEIIEQCQQLPFMGSSRLVVVKDVNIDETLLEYIKNPVETTCLVLIIRKIDKRLGVYKELERYTEIQEFNHPNEKDIAGWIAHYIHSKKKRISIRDATYISDILENNLTNIVQELEKLITYAGERNIIAEEDIEAVISSNKITDNFRFTDAIQNKDTPNAIKLVNHLLDQGNSTQKIIGTIRWMLTRLWHAKDGDIGELHIPSYFQHKFIKQSEKFSIQELKDGLVKLLTIEKLMRTYAIPERLILELLVVQFTEKTTASFGISALSLVTNA